MGGKQRAGAVFSGCMCGLIVVLRTVSFASYIFSDKLAIFLEMGLRSMLWSGIVGQGINILRTCTKGIRGEIVGSSSAQVPLLSTLIASLMATRQDLADPEASYLLIFSMMVVGILSGILMLFLGALRLARLLMFLPFPVSRGFFGALGLSMMIGACSTACGTKLKLLEPSSFSVLAETTALGQVLVCVTFGVVLRIVRIRLNTCPPMVFPLVMLGSLFVFLLLVLITFGFSFEVARQYNWLPKPVTGSTDTSDHLFYSFLLALDPAVATRDTAASIAENLSTVVALCLFVVVDMSLNLPALIDLDKSDTGLDPDQELTTAGFASLCASLVGGGGATYVTLSPTKINHESGGKNSNVSCIAALVVNLLALFLGPSLVSIMPPSYVGGLLFYAGLAYLIEGLWDCRLLMTHWEYACTVLISGVSVAFGMLEGVGIGIVISSVLFIATYSNQPFVRSGFDVSSENLVTNTTVRLQEDDAKILALQSWVSVVVLRGYLFFGSVENVSLEVRKRLLLGDTRCIIFDFRRLWGIESSALNNFKRMIALANKKNITVVFTSLPKINRDRSHSKWSCFAPFVQRLGCCANVQKKAADSSQAVSPLLGIAEQFARAGLLVHVQQFESLRQGKEWCVETFILKPAPEHAKPHQQPAGYTSRQGTPTEKLQWLLDSLCHSEDDRLQVAALSSWLILQPRISLNPGDKISQTKLNLKAAQVNRDSVPAYLSTSPKTLGSSSAVADLSTFCLSSEEVYKSPEAAPMLVEKLPLGIDGFNADRCVDLSPERKETAQPAAAGLQLSENQCQTSVISVVDAKQQDEFRRSCSTDREEFEVLGCIPLRSKLCFLHKGVVEVSVTTTPSKKSTTKLPVSLLRQRVLGTDRSVSSRVRTSVPTDRETTPYSPRAKHPSLDDDDEFNEIRLPFALLGKGSFFMLLDDSTQGQSLLEGKETYLVADKETHLTCVDSDAVTKLAMEDSAAHSLLQRLLWNCYMSTQGSLVEKVSKFIALSFQEDDSA